MDLDQHIYNAIADWNENGENDDEHGNRRYTHKQISDMAEYFAEFASMVE